MKQTFLSVANGVNIAKTGQKTQHRFNEDKSKVLAEWKNSWFKGQYENIEAKIISQNKGKK